MSAVDTQVLELLDTSQMDDSPSMTMGYSFDSLNENDIVSRSFMPFNYPPLHMPTRNSYESFSTVSPPEIMSAPPSAAPSAVTTSLTTPDFGVDEYSPAFSNDPSPQLFSDDALMTPDLTIDPLDFFGELPSIHDAVAQESHAQSTSQSPISDSPAHPVALPMSRKCSSGKTSSRASHEGRHSLSSGISKRKSRTEPLPPIVVDDPTDMVALKRARNTAAARKSRKRREDHMNALEAQIEKLKEEVDYWKNQALSKH